MTKLVSVLDGFSKMFSYVAPTWVFGRFTSHTIYFLATIGGSVFSVKKIESDRIKFEK